MNVRVLCLLASSIALHACAGDPPPPPSDICPPGLVATGDPCNTSVRCMSGQDECAVAQVCECDLATYQFQCAPLDTAAPCDDIQAAGCSIEGIHGCVGFPTSGFYYCEDDLWVATYSCPDGCPGPDAAPPVDGDACAVVEGEVCPYGATECECVAGTFRCCDPAPCL